MSISNEPTIWMTTVEAGAYLRISPRTLADKRVDGTGPRFFKVGPGQKARVIYRRDDLEAWLSKFGFLSTSEMAKK
ncbi:MAG: helix-turn-helix domain-containing protein [Hyphomicrobiaceae bacterium]